MRNTNNTGITNTEAEVLFSVNKKSEKLSLLEKIKLKFNTMNEEKYIKTKDICKVIENQR